MNIKILIIIFFFNSVSTAGLHFAFSQNIIDENIRYDSIIMHANQTVETKPKISLTNSLLAYQNAIKNNDNNQELIALKLISKAYFNIGNNQNALKHYKLALSIAVQENDKISEIEILNYIGVLYRLMGSFNQSFENHLKALELCNKVKNSDTIKIQIMNDFGVLYRNLNEIQKAKYNYNIALDLSKKINYIHGQAISYQNIGNLFYYSQNYDSSLLYYNKALENISINNFRPSFKLGILNNIGNVYRVKKDYKTAFSYYNLAIEISNSIEDKNLKAIVYKNKAKTYKDKGEVDLAEKFFLKSSQIAGEIELKSVLIENYYELSDLYEKNNSHQKSLEYYKLFSLLKDSVFENERNIYISDIEKQYNTKKQEEAINQLILKKQRSNIIFLTIIGLFLIIIIFINAKRLKLKKKDNILILEQKIKLESLNHELKKNYSELEKHKFQLIESEQLYRMIFDNSPLGNALFSSQGIVQKVNNSMLKILGLVSEKEIISQNIFDFPMLKRTSILIDFENVVLKNKTESGEIQIKTADSKKVVVYYNLYPLVDENDKVVKVQAITVDISDKFIQDKTINAKNAELQEMNATKDRFFSIIAHDLKNPFNAVMGFANLLRDDYESISDEERKQFIDNIALASEDINNLLENLLKWAWSQSGKIEHKPEKVNPIDIINECIDLVKVQAEKKQIKLDRVHGETAFIYVDNNMIRTVIRNLLSNSIKFTPSGGEVKINFLIKMLSNQNGHSEVMEIAVNDNGIGISPDDIQSLFVIDSRVKNLGTEGESGTGLGLILCKEFVQKNGGTLNVESTLGRGSTFTFTVPLFNKLSQTESKTLQEKN